MNILQHKSWHVYSQKNQDRVKRDEAKAEAEEKKTQRRAIAADQEHRLMILRQRAAKRYANVPGIEDGEDIDAHSDALIPIANDTVAVAKPKSEHVNFWADLEKQDTASKKGNPEYEAEQKAKERKWERTIAVHLDSANSGPTPWYTTPGAGSMTATSKKSGDTSFSKIQEDPLQNMRTMLDKRKISLEKKDKRERSRSPTSRKHARTSDYSRSIVKEMPTGMSTMAKLRMERLLREQEEKTKAMLLVNPDYIDPAVHHQPTGRYNQQFNPQATSHAHSTFRPYNRDRAMDQTLLQEPREFGSLENRISREDRQRNDNDGRYYLHDDRRRDSGSSGDHRERHHKSTQDRYKSEREHSSRDSRENRHVKDGRDNRRRDYDKDQSEPSRTHRDTHSRSHPYSSSHRRSCY